MNGTDQPGSWRHITAKALPWLTLLVYAELSTVGAFSGGMWGGVGIGYSLALYLCAAWLDRSWPRPSRDFLGLALAALATMGLLNPGSVNPGISWFDWERLATIFLPLALLTAPAVKARADHMYFFTVLILAIFAGAFALGVELFLGAPVLHILKGDRIGLTQYNRGLSYLVLLAMPALAALWTLPFATPNQPFRSAVEKVAPFLLLIAVLLFPAGLTESRAAKLALVAALLTAAAAYRAPQLTRRGLGGLVILLLGWPIIVQKSFIVFQDQLGRLPDSWRARMEIWDYMSYRIFEHPWLGWGLGTSKALDFRDPHGDLYKFVLAAAPHPHNVVTQLWVELGLPGLALGVAFALLTLRQAGRLRPPLVPFAYGAWVAALCLCCVAYNFWTDSLFSAFALTGFAFALLDRRLGSAHR
jgi:O-antigen ligase